MFQRLQKGFNLDFLDNKIAEEQENQRQLNRASSAASRGAGNAGARRGRGLARGRGASQGSHEKGHNVGPAVKGPDPEDFVIGEESSDPSRVTAPAPSTSVEIGQEGPETSEEKLEKGNEVSETDELPFEVQRKLAKLETLTTRYQELLRNYRTAHAHVAVIEPFEAALREHTPLTSIADPNALVEFLNQRGLQSEMVLSELKRVTAEHKDIAKERDELKVKLIEAEQKAKEAFDEAAGLRNTEGSISGKESANDVKGLDLRDGPSRANAPPAASQAESQAAPEKDEFFSYDSELSKSEAASQLHQEQIAQLQNEVKGQQAYTTEILDENATLKQNLEDIRKDLDAKSKDLSTRDQTITTLKTELHNATTQLESQNSSKSESVRSEAREAKRMETLQGLVDSLRGQVLEAEQSKKTAESKVNDLQFELKRLEAEISSSANIISKLRGHEAKVHGLEKKITEIEHERDDAKRLVDAKKGHEMAAASLRSQLKRTEKDRDAAYQMIIDCGRCDDPAKMREKDEDGVADEHPSAVDHKSPGESEAAEDASHAAENQETEMATTGDSKKKNKKKKNKAKKKASEDVAPVVATSGIPTLDELIQDPTKGSNVLLKGNLADNPLGPLLINMVETLKERGDSRDDDHDSLLRHHEGMIEQHEQTIKNNAVLIRAQNEEIFALKKDIDDNNAPASAIAERDARIESLSKDVHSLQYIIKEKDVEIRKLQERLRGEAELCQHIEDLTEETETLKDSVIENGKNATDALHELKMVKEQNQKLLDEQGAVEASNSKLKDEARERNSQADTIRTQCKSLETEIAELKASASSSEEIRGVQDQLAKLQEERDLLQADKTSCENQIKDLQAQIDTSKVEAEARQQSLGKELASSQSKAADLERELAVANQLAQTRFKDLSDLRELFNKVQSELKRLREESTELKNAKAELEKASAGLKRLESKERDLRSEITEYKTQMSQKDSEIAGLKDKVRKSDERSTALEESYEMARRDLEKSESTRDEAVEAREKLQANLRSLEDELKKSRSNLSDLDAQVKRFSDQANRAREELELKSAQQASAQSLMDSLQDQTRELATQMKEARERNESLDEELADARRLLSERSREGETMRRLLGDVEGRAEERVKEMRERMDLAVEERDQAEDKASTIGRRKTRELDDLRAKLQDANSEATRATAAREIAERRERESLSRHEELERRAAQATSELSEVRAAMVQLRDALDEGERQSRALEKDKAELRRTLDDRDARLEKLQKSSRIMAEEFHSLQAAQRLRQTNLQHASQHQHSERSSTDTTTTSISSPTAVATTAAVRALSPAPHSPARLQTSVTGGAHSSPRTSGAVGGGSKDGAGVDFVYLKTVLLQFLEQKEKKHQMQLVPVLGMLLHFDNQDEQKLTAAISSR